MYLAISACEQHQWLSIYNLVNQRACEIKRHQIVTLNSLLCHLDWLKNDTQ
jgi:hypothetical protein